MFSRRCRVLRMREAPRSRRARSAACRTLFLGSQQVSVAQWKSAWLGTEGLLVLIPLQPCTFFLQFYNFMSFMYEVEIFELHLL